MKLSNVGDVGQMRRRSGTSTNMSVKPEHLCLPVSVGLWFVTVQSTYMHIMPKAMRALRWKRWDMPRAMQRSMHSIPILKEKILASSFYD